MHLLGEVLEDAWSKVRHEDLAPGGPVDVLDRCFGDVLWVVRVIRVGVVGVFLCFSRWWVVV